MVQYILPLRISLIIFIIFSIGSRLIISCYNGPTCFHPYRFYTIQTNTLILIWLVLAVLWRDDEVNYDRLVGFTKGALTTYITITSLVFIVLIEPTYDPVGIDWATSLFNHYLNPWLFVLDTIITERYQARYPWKWGIYWLIYPLFYLVYTQVWGAIYNFYPYFFVNRADLGLSAFLAWVSALMLIFTIIGLVHIAINRKLHVGSDGTKTPIK